MSKIYQSMAALILALVSLGGCDYQPLAVGDVNPARVADTREVLRDLWVGHIFSVRNVVMSIATENPAARDAAEKEVLANAKQIARMMKQFYGKDASEKLFSVLVNGYGAVKEYSEATVAGNKRRQDAALVQFASNADDFAVFISGVNPYLPEDTVRVLMAVHGAQHVLQINQLQEKGYAHIVATWPAMRQHMQIVADTLTTALVKQFPNKFS